MRTWHGMFAGVLSMASAPWAVSADAGQALIAEAGGIAHTAIESGNNTITGRDGWLFFAPELRHMAAGVFWGDAAPHVSRASKPDQADPLPAILDFADQLKRVGVELMLVPVPTKASIYPEKIFQSAIAGVSERVDRLHQEFFDLLRAAGVEVIDPAAALLAAKEHRPMFCRQDTHWSGAACEVVAGLLGAEITKRDWFSAVPKHEYESTRADVEISGDLAAGAADAPIEKEVVPLRFVGNRVGGALEPVEPDDTSPVVLLGDSHNLVFHAGADMHAAGAGLPDQLALELGFPVDLVAVRGSGATPARINLLRRARRPGYLEGKKLVIWCFTVREFTESSGWMKVPVVR